jgi:outer membrane murein-binding lipoprotein Lpp
MIEGWALVAVAAILAGVISEWFKVRTKQRHLGASTSELEREVDAMKKEREAILDRLQNLEAIVVSQTWDALHDKSLAPAERDLRVASTARHEIAAPDTESVNRQRAEQLARRLQG